MNYKKVLLIGIIIIAEIHFLSAQNNITITDNASHNADASAMLDVYSTSKGMLVPRMSSMQIAVISNPATGLLVFNTDVNSFFFYSGTVWKNLSDGGTDIWGVNSSTGDVYVNDLQTNIGIGTDEPVSKLAVVANSGANPDDALFEIQDEFGIPIFSVTSEGVRIYVKDIESSKGISGGFAVGKYGSAKGMPDTTFLMVTPDSTRVYLAENTKGISGGFAVGKYGSAKGGSNTIFYADADSTRVFTSITGKGVSGGFAVGKYGAAKAAGDRYTYINDDNCFIGLDAGLNNNSSPPLGVNNVFIGKISGKENVTGSANVYIGAVSGSDNNGMFNVFMGNAAGANAITSRSVFIGSFAGQHETESDKLYIETSDVTGSEALIYGDFLNDNLRFNANVAINGDINPLYSLAVYGDAWTNGTWTGSDKKWKKNINSIDYGLSIINKLKPVTYYWRKNDYPEMNFTKDRQIGFIAQELEILVPELVKTDSMGNKAVSYNKLTPILVKAIQEQQEIINNQEKRLKKLEESNKELKEIVNSLIEK